MKTEINLKIRRKGIRETERKPLKPSPRTFVMPSDVLK